MSLVCIECVAFERLIHRIGVFDSIEIKPCVSLNFLLPYVVLQYTKRVPRQMTGPFCNDQPQIQELEIDRVHNLITYHSKKIYFAVPLFVDV